ncbi:AAC(3) family N-acetyltransferase [Erysipelothrix sp. HDW6C]|uniref:AAC(3) family N-acetyltransferase n=1 Tax=Erysipelothrix sp. HDW6C TaxID=2714930 RepID=UPI00140A4ED7|nr:AAC(3) family N-acetyltransferase [Erysipelothrix sp. HDW6C]QIK69917.1 AAC(3) family N-acetyltransferase [Erysipelothrix sp. HDW6C]
MVQSNQIDVSVRKLMKRLDVSPEGVVLLHENDKTAPYNSKRFLEAFKDYLKPGTLSIFGDVAFNTNVVAKDALPQLNNQERLVLSSGKMLQLLVLDAQTTFAHHPSLMLGSVGKFSKFLARHVTLDFPYGEKSIFNDLYELNAVVVFVGEPQDVPELHYVATTMRAPIIKKNTCYRDHEIKSYLDYDIDSDRIVAALLKSNVLLYETVGDSRIYGITFHDLIQFAQKQF